MANHKTRKFAFGVFLAAILALIIMIGPPMFLYFLLHPQNFWERSAALVVSAVLFVPCFIAALGTWIGVASEFE